MYDASLAVIYVGKAKDLKKRLASYFRSAHDTKTTQLINNIHDVKFTITSSETEALLLECELIRQYKPKYNIIFKDGKTYPYICITEEMFPQIKFFRGKTTDQDNYFGPYPSASSVKETIDLIHKIFKLRNCTNSYFANRTRPCLQHQIKLCSAPCTKLIDEKDYEQDVTNAKKFLRGEVSSVLNSLTNDMERAALELNFEKAAVLRDQIDAVRNLTKKQNVINVQNNADLDVIAIESGPMTSVIHVLVVRGGRVIGTLQETVNNKLEYTDVELMQQFIMQHYTASVFAESRPDKVLINIELQDAELIANTLKFKIQYIKVVLGKYHSELMQIAINSARAALLAKLDLKRKYATDFESLSILIGMDLNSIECFDISHNQGECTVGSVVQYDVTGPVRKNYRRYNIKNVANGDDYAAMQELLRRHLTKLITSNNLPNLLLIDGGKGQIKQAEIVCNELNIDIKILGIAKGAGRKTGNETFYLDSDGNELLLEVDTAGFMLLAQIRDEAHRFAITGHRARKASKQITSTLESIPGIGYKKRKALMNYFGGLSETKAASVAELASVPGIDDILAKRIYYALHPDRLKD